MNREPSFLRVAFSLVFGFVLSLGLELAACGASEAFKAEKPRVNFPFAVRVDGAGESSVSVTCFGAGISSVTVDTLGGGGTGGTAGSLPVVVGVTESTTDIKVSIITVDGEFFGKTIPRDEIEGI